MLDLRWIREDPAAFDAAMARRGLPAQSVVVLDLDAKRRALQTEIQDFQASKNAASKRFGIAKQQGEDTSVIVDIVNSTKELLAAREVEESNIARQLNEFLFALPNVMDRDIPVGPDDDSNLEVRRVGEPKIILNPIDHATLGEKLGLMDFETAARISGARFTILTGGLSKLERALGQLMLDVATNEHGYTECSVPLMVRDEAAFGTGQLPKFAEDLFKTTDGRWLISTSEMSLTNIVADQIIEGEKLPLRLTSLTPCFRSEAGSAGRDTRGMIRQHQFWKVEMVSITDPESSAQELERMTGCAETILKKLDLPFRTVLKCTGETGFTARKTYDLEVWLPAQNTYREISSCSNCGDFQARRMKARFRRKGEKDTQFVHTLNGSGVAVGRALVAVMENYQNPDGSISVPDVLKPYMGGLERIEAAR